MREALLRKDEMVGSLIVRRAAVKDSASKSFVTPNRLIKDTKSAIGVEEGKLPSLQ